MKLRDEGTTDRQATPVEVRGEFTVPPDKLAKAQDLVGEMNVYLKQPVVCIRINAGWQASGNGHTLSLPIGRFEIQDREFETLVWHELAHMYFEELAGPFTDFLKNDCWSDYGEDLGSLYGSMLHRSFIDFGKYQLGGWVSWDLIKPGSVATVFNPTSYNQPNRSGQPFRTEGELFACASEILRYYPEELAKRIEGLKTDRDKQLAMEIVETVGSVF